MRQPFIRKIPSLCCVSFRLIFSGENLILREFSSIDRKQQFDSGGERVLADGETVAIQFVNLAIASDAPEFLFGDFINAVARLNDVDVVWPEYRHVVWLDRYSGQQSRRHVVLTVGRKLLCCRRLGGVELCRRRVLELLGLCRIRGCGSRVRDGRRYFIGNETCLRVGRNHRHGRDMLARRNNAIGNNAVNVILCRIGDCRRSNGRLHIGRLCADWLCRSLPCHRRLRR